MRIRIIIALCFVLSVSRVATADPIFVLEGLPTTYTPGSTFTFDLKLNGVTNLNAYTVSLLMESAGGTPGAGNDFFFEDLPDDLSDLPSNSRYVFQGDGFGRGDARGEAGQFTKLTLLDSLADFNAEVDTVAGLNDLIARVRVTTSASMDGPLRFSFDPGDTLLIDSLGDDIPGFNNLTYVPASGTSFVVQAMAVPEPAAMAQVLVAASVGGLVCLIRSRRTLMATFFPVQVPSEATKAQYQKSCNEITHACIVII